MVDFTQYIKPDSTDSPIDPIELFDSLDRKASHTALRPVQTEALTALYERRNERDLVLKLSTGAGKTTVALVYLYSHMREKRQPAVYLCPTTQLAEQVVAEARHLGIKAVLYPPGEPLPGADALAGRAIVVCSYDKLFNARTTFDRHDVQLTPCALVLDDAHSGIQEVRDSFSLRIGVDDLYDKLLKILGPRCKEHHPGQWTGIERKDAAACLEVPFWIWASILGEIREVLEDHGNVAPYVFVWGYLRDQLRWCRCVISGRGIEIFLDVPAVHLARPYNEAGHRVYMSATLSDDSSLVRELGCSAAAASTPILPPSDGGIGERMVLAPSLIDPALDRAQVMEWSKNLSKQVRVAVLSSSEKLAREWEAVGATVELGSKVGETVAALRTGKLRFVAFAQRYDGVDLPDDSCRVLVLDGMPMGAGIAEDHDRSIPGRPEGELRRWTYRIEQGMGRAVRSHADYAVIVLAGPELCNFLAKRDVRNLLGAGTNAQLDLAEEMVEIAKDSGDSPNAAVVDMIRKCINRDPGWRSFYDAKVRKRTRELPPEPNERQIQLAESEHMAQQAAMKRDTQLAIARLDDATKLFGPEQPQLGWLLQRKANFLYEINKGEAMEIQKAAFRKNDRMYPPPTGIVDRPPALAKSQTASLVLSWYNGFTNPNGAIAQLEELKSKLSFESTVETLEQALDDLSRLFGAEGRRPEKQYRRGPDNLWAWPEFAWVIEVKHQRGTLPKADGNQMLSSMQWFEEMYPEHKAVSIVVARTVKAERDAFFPQNTRVLTPHGLSDLVENVGGFLTELVMQKPLFWRPQAINELLHRFRLSPAQFAGNYTEVLEK